MEDHNKDKRSVAVSMNGDFPEKYLSEIRYVFGLYSKAEGVDVGFIREEALVS